MKILVVDDNPMNRRLQRALLGTEGHEVVVAADGVEALEVLERQPIDAVISDVLMPRMDGYRLCREIRGREPLRLLPVIIYTASYDSPGDEKLALDSGADKILAKTGPVEELLAALREVTTDERYRRPREVKAPPELEVQKEFSELLVAKLEEKNQELSDRTAEMRAAEQRLRHLLAHTPAVLYTLRVEGHRVEPVVVTENIERLLGVAAASTSYAWWHDSLHPDDRERVLAAVRRALAEGGYSIEYRLRHRDGSYRWVQDNATVLRDDGGAPLEMIGAWTDVTERRRLESQLLQAQKMESLGRLAGGVAHDFNNMLGVMTGYAELLLFQLPADEQLRGYVEEIVRAGQRAAGLTRQLLAFSRRQLLQPRVLDLNRVVAEVEKMLRHVIGEDVELQTDLEERLPAVEADPGQLEQVLLNLAVNARDAMPGGGRLTISTRRAEVADEPAAAALSTLPAGAYVLLSVADTGHGMPAEVREQIFEPFFTTKEPGKGTGLGLATVHGIVQQSGGRVVVDSEPGRGARFDVWLPVAGAAPAERRTGPRPALSRGNETVLLVEDEPALRALVGRLLRAAGYEVIEAGDGAQAVRLIADYQGAIHLLLTDVVLPGCSGTEVARQLAEQRPETKVLFMSGYADDSLLQLGDLGSASVLAKPFDALELGRKVRAALGRPSGETDDPGRAT